jgi:ABC-type phosphate/phosphonate transport system ATPase subunit
MALLEVDDIHVFYDQIEALKGVTLAVEEKRIVTLIGGNGAGKSTTLRAISGLLNPRTWRHQFRRNKARWAWCARDRGARPRVGAGRPSYLRSLDSRGKPGDGRLHPPRGAPRSPPTRRR